MSREQLRELPAKHRTEAIREAVNNMSLQVVQSATAGNLFHLVIVRLPGNQSGIRQYPPPYNVTTDDLVEGFKEKFPGCRVEYTETWENVRPGVKEQRSGILVDWS